MSTTINTNSIATGAVTAPKLAANSCTTPKIPARNVTFPKLPAITTDRLLGRDTAGSGDAEELTVGGGLEFSGGGGIRVADAGVTYAKAAAGFVVQVVNSITGAVATGTTVIPWDDTIPQNTEGDQYLSLAITPKATAHKLRIDVVLVLANSAAAYEMSAALFQDSTAGALAAASVTCAAANTTATLHLTHYMAAGAVAATTFKVRAGGSAAGTTTLNGSAGARKFGGIAASSITITEIKA